MSDRDSSQTTLARARRATLHERDALRQQRRMVWPPPEFTVERGVVEPVNAKRKRRRGSAVSGGRWRRIVLTTAMTLALTVLVVNGLYRLAGKALYDQPKPPPGSGFPVAAASGYAARFGQAYLTWDQADPGRRTDELRVFFPDARHSDFGWDGTGRQSLLGAPVVAGVTARDDSHGVVHLAAYLDPGGWACMDVAMFAADGGTAFAITSYVAFVSCPPAAAASMPPDTVEDDSLFGERLRPTLETFLKAYAASAPEIAQSTTQDSAIWGLGGMVSFVELAGLKVPTVDDPATETRTADVRVRWRLPSGGTLLQAYRLTLREIGGRWFVRSVEGGVEDPDVAPVRGGVPTASPPPSPLPAPPPTPLGSPSARPSASAT